jgi:hypothetical protein
LKRLLIALLPACDALWKQGQRKSSELQDAYIASHLEDHELFEQGVKAEEDSDAAFHRCFAERAPSQAFSRP